MRTISERPDFGAVTSRQQLTWAAGDFNVLAMTIMPVAEALVAAVDPHAGQRVLDVACGSGNTALVAARRFCHVAGVDYVPPFVERARQRAAADGVKVEFREGDAQALPFPEASFDAVLSTFGVMFAPDQERAAGELLRVCKSGGRIGLAVWMPEAYGLDLFRTTAKYMPPPAGVKPPLRWGTEDGLRELLGAGTTDLRTDRRMCRMYYRSVDHAVEIYRTYFGPIARACQVLDAVARDALVAELRDVFGRYNRATDGTLIIGAEYLQVVATRR
jgi:SAM-dependent methyltransferase